MGNPVACVLQLISLSFLIAIVVVSSRVYNLTEEEPFKGSDIITDTPYSTDQESLTDTTTNLLNQGDNYIKNYGKHCQCGEEIVNDFCSEEQIIAGCFDITLKNDKLFLINLYECSELIEYVNSKGSLSKAFELNFDMVHKMSLGILTINSIVLGTFALLLFSAVCAICGGDCIAALLVLCFPCIIIIVLFSGLANFVILIILMVNYYKGYTTGDLLDYYDCHDNIGKSVILLELDIEKLKSLDSNMTALVVLTFIGMVINCIASGLSKGEEEKS